MTSILTRIKPWQLVLGICVFIALCYWQTIRNGFVWDDIRLVEINQDIGNWDSAPSLFLGRSLFESHGAVNKQHIYYKPLLGLWWMLNYAQWGGAKAAGFHITQLGLHLVNTVLVYYLVLLILRHQIEEKLRSVPHEIYAGLVALLWGIHPANSESVAYIAAAQEPLYLFWGLLSLLIILSRQRIIEWLQQTHKWPQERSLNLLWGVVGLLWLASLLSKEAGLVIAPICFLYVALVEQHPHRKQLSVVWILTWLLYFIMRFAVAGVAISAPSESIPIHQATTIARLQTVPYVLFEHLRVVAFPKDLFTGNFVIIDQVDVIWAAKVVVIIGLTLIMFRLSRQDRISRWLFVSGIISLGLVSNIFPLDMTFSERWVYLPSLFFVWFWIWQVRRWSNVLVYVGLFLAIAYGIRVYQRVPNWQSQFTLAEHDSQYEVDGYQVAINYAKELSALGREDEALVWLEKSIQMNPHYWVAYNNIGSHYAEIEDWPTAEEYYRLAIEKGNGALAWENLAIIYYKTQDEQLDDTLKKGLTFYPGNQTLRYLQSVAATKSAQPKPEEK